MTVSDQVSVAGFLVAMSLALLVGCSSVTFKRGASPTTMADDERACRAENGSEKAAYRTCMRDRGWFIAHLDRDDVEVPINPPDEQATPLVVTPDVTIPDSPEQKPAISAPATRRSTRKASAPPTADQLQSITVASWWKLGGNVAVLDGDIADCVAELGIAHRPTSGTKTVTEGIRTCLRGRGWYGFGK